MKLVKPAAMLIAALVVHGGQSAAQSTRSVPQTPVPDSLRLSRRQAIGEALQHNGQLEIAGEQTAEARARRVTGIAVPDPLLTAAFDQETSPFGFGGAGARPVALGVAIPFPTKFRLNGKIGTAGIRVSESNYRFQQQTVALRASATYDSLLVGLMHRSNALEARGLAADFLQRTQARFAAGTVARLDVIQAQLGLAQADNDLIANEGSVALAQASLTRVLGRETGPPVAPTDSLDMPAPLPDSLTIMQLALTRRPELAVVQNQQEGAHAITQLTKAFWHPDLTLAVQRDYVAPGSPLFTAGIAMPVPFFYWQHAKGDIAQAQHFERELSATYRDTRAEIARDVRSVYATARTAMRQVAFLRDQLVPAAREAYRVASTSYSLGGSSALEVLTARAALLQAQNQFADALATANTARADLDRALGINVPLGAANR
jgi:outer membrane protein TolC